VGSDQVSPASEQCDDGHLRPGDCCSATCTLEPNCQCLTPNPPLSPPRQVCSSTVACGDSKVGGTEVCDDGNTLDGDGCSHDCNNIEIGYDCPSAGGTCTPRADPCGNGSLDSQEACDDHNQVAGDGCAANCQVEPGYVCPTAGQACQPIEVCGDRKVSYTRGETCDDRNQAAGDGCSATCHIEPGYVCTTAQPSVCTYDVACADRRITGSETCDDGNQTAGDGCSATCPTIPRRRTPPARPPSISGTTTTPRSTSQFRGSSRYRRRPTGPTCTTARSSIPMWRPSSIR
jgi:cysteine-rich repeat protein